MSAEKSTAKLFVGNFPYMTDEEQLKEIFSVCGDVLEVKIIRERLSGRSRGYGFVTFSDQTAADQALKTLHDHDVNGRKLRVDRAKKSVGEEVT